MHDNWIRLLHTGVSLSFICLPESPPHYASLFKKIETARAEESNHVSLFYRLIAMFFNTGESGHTVSSTLLILLMLQRLEIIGTHTYVPLTVGPNLHFHFYSV